MPKKVKQTHKEEQGGKKKKTVRVRPKTMEEYDTTFKKLPN